MPRDITQARLKELLLYEASTGTFTWRIRPSIGTAAGSIAGTLDARRGYIRIGVDGAIYRAHRLAFLYVTGAWPTLEVDHINGNKADNAFANLRDVDRLTNQQNVRSARGGNPLPGVTFHAGTGKWRARVWSAGRNRSLGLFDSATVAHAAYVAAKRVEHPGCTL